MKNEFDEKWKFLLQVLVAKSVRRTSIITFQKISNFQEKKIHKRNDFTLKKEMDEARKKKKSKYRKCWLDHFLVYWKFLIWKTPV